MSRRASRPGTQSEPEPPELIVEDAFEPPIFAGAPVESAPDTPDDDPVVPRVSPSDDPRVWGESPDSNDRRLRDGVPPHW